MPTDAALILVVDDEPLLRMHAAAIFEEAGFATVEAGSADDAVDLLQSRDDIRVVFTDVEMPGTMNGLKFALLVPERWPTVAVVLTSGKVDGESCAFLRTASLWQSCMIGKSWSKRSEN